MSVSLSYLQHIAYNLRVSSLVSTSQAGSGHPTTCLSAADLVAAIFFHAMRFDPQKNSNPNNDRFILSKGHAAPLLYAVWKELGILSGKDLLTLRKFDSVLEGHPTLRFAQSEAATGSLGQGLSIGLGAAYSTRITNASFDVYVLLGDSELTEGSIWEACEVASFYKVDNLIAVADINRLGQSTATTDQHDMSSYVEKFSAFGWKTIIVDGHDMAAIVKALNEAKSVKGQPSILLAKTYKGYGVDEVENKLGFHGKAFSQEKLPAILQSLEDRFSEDASAPKEIWQPNLSAQTESRSYEKITLEVPSYKKDEEVPTRKAFGQALKACGDVSEQVVSLDAEVKNSTYAEIFEKAHPDRFVQCFIAEQNMVGMGVGFVGRGLIPFISTFGAFFSRAYDQVRMAAVGTSSLRLVGSHAGVSIGEDGPSQMALEDIAMMRALPDSAVLYPSDAVSTYKLVELMANRDDGISYLRTTRMATPIIYDVNETFELGGCKVLRQSGNDVVCIVGAGVTLFEALKAYETLKKQGIFVSVIDLYSIKPLDVKTLTSVGARSGNRIITVEDHYQAGGIGEAVSAALSQTDIKISSLAVKELPRSGTPQQLLHAAGINADAIVQSVIQKV